MTDTRRTGEPRQRGAQVRSDLIARGRSGAARLPGRWDRRARELGKAIVDYRGARRAYPRQLLFGLARRSATVLQVPFGRARLLIPTDDDEIGRVVFATGGYERIYMASAVEELSRLGCEIKGRTFIDIGANIGTSTIDALVEFGFGQAVCFEPEERNYRLLMANVALNGLESRVRGYPAALSAATGSSLLERSATNRGDNRLIAGDMAGAAADLVAVQCLRFDDLTNDGAICLDDVGLMWLDAQGHEPFVLQGASEALAAGVPLVLEYSPLALRTSGALSDLEAMIREHYTTVFDLHRLSAGLRAGAVFASSDIGRLRALDDFDHTDLLLVRSAASNL
jgi:FkbM family methyltransferase